MKHQNASCFKRDTRALSSKYENKMIANSKRFARALSSKNENKMIANSKRSQFKIQQMSFMLFSVFFFFVLIGLFYVSIQYRNIRESATDLSRNRAMIMSEFISGMSEFSCGSYCID